MSDARPARSPSPEFASAWELAGQIPGWLTRDQALALWDAALRVPRGGRIVEIGSHQGRSTAVLGEAARLAGASVVAVDPFVEGRLFGGPLTRKRFEDNVFHRAGLAEVVELIPEYSTVLRPTWNRPIALLYVDGKHDYWTFTDDLRWSEHLPPDAEVLVHDAFSSIGVTGGVAVRVLCGSRYTFLDRTGSLARFRLRRPTPRDRLRVLAQTPWFLRNVAVKVLLRLRLRPLTRLLSHRGPHDPY
ncbi:class I SAM-dependent methyltransferase [Umezawaea beigongshangensis]|uniref:class I SAM-dependent methyltransferase n=1 Tax=Umezawaea beigongshangensis TaxID=2780383 RepID=UPI0018F1EA4A|nr:class I SAM-dependent methyltransferase [Umezawaea beigongshangensis]